MVNLMSILFSFYLVCITIIVILLFVMQHKQHKLLTAQIAELTRQVSEAVKPK